MSAPGHDQGMDAVRLGLSVRALRRRAGLTQAALGRRAGSSASAISRIERAHAGEVTLDMLERVAVALGARLAVTILWQGEALDRLLDSGHARLVDWTIRWLGGSGWDAAPEITFQVRGERGSVDVLARHPSGALLIVEVKSVVPDIQALLAGLDRKARLARLIAAERRWADAATVSRVLILPADRTSRRRVAAFDSTFGAALPARSTVVRRWVREPIGTLAGVLFVPIVTDTATRHRVSRASTAACAGTTSPGPQVPVNLPPGGSLSANR